MKRKLFIVIVIILVIFISIFLILNRSKDNPDGLKFKEEYEKYNNIETDDGYVYPTVTIDKNNPMYYATGKEIIKLLKSGTGIIFFGSPTDPWSRNAINVLLDASSSTAIDKIYYMDLTKKYDFYEVKNGQVINTREASDDYLEMVKILDKHLNNYILNNDDDYIDTNIKRIFMPFVIFVKEGKIISTREGTTASHINNGNGYIELQKGEINELYNYYVDKMIIIADASCDKKC